MYAVWRQIPLFWTPAIIELQTRHIIPSENFCCSYLIKADLHDAHVTSLRQAYNMTWDHLHAHDFFQLQN